MNLQKRLPKKNFSFFVKLLALKNTTYQNPNLYLFESLSALI